MNILPVADKIFGDEKAIYYYELNYQAPDYSGFHRYQIVHVPRNGIICEWRKDMGSVDNYKGISQLRIPSLMEHTVDELMEMANELRIPKFDIKDRLQLENYIPG